MLLQCRGKAQCRGQGDRIGVMGLRCRCWGAGAGQDEVSQGPQERSSISPIAEALCSILCVSTRGVPASPSFHLMVYCHARSHCSLWVSTSRNANFISCGRQLRNAPQQFPLLIAL